MIPGRIRSEDGKVRILFAAIVARTFACPLVLLIFVSLMTSVAQAVDGSAWSGPAGSVLELSRIQGSPPRCLSANGGTADWYRRTLGFHQVTLRGEPQGLPIVLQRGPNLILVYNDPLPEAPRTCKVLPNAAAFTIVVDDVDAETSRLSNLGVDVIAGPRDRAAGTQRITLIRDNDGRLIRLRELISY